MNNEASNCAEQPRDPRTNPRPGDRMIYTSSGDIVEFVQELDEKRILVQRSGVEYALYRGLWGTVEGKQYERGDEGKAEPPEHDKRNAPQPGDRATFPDGTGFEYVRHNYELRAFGDEGVCAIFLSVFDASKRKKAWEKACDAEAKHADAAAKLKPGDRVTFNDGLWIEFNGLDSDGDYMLSMSNPRIEATHRSPEMKKLNRSWWDYAVKGETIVSAKERAAAEEVFTPFEPGGTDAVSRGSKWEVHTGRKPFEQRREIIEADLCRVEGGTLSLRNVEPNAIFGEVENVIRAWSSGRWNEVRRVS